MSLNKITLKNLIQSKIVEIFIGTTTPVDFTGNPDKGIEAFADAIITHLIDCGVSGSDSPALQNLDALGVYVGAASGSISPDYSSTIYITDGDNVTIAIGKLDAGLNLISSSFSGETLDQVTDRGNTTTNNLIIGGLSLSNNKIINVTDPTDAQDVATKQYVDNSFQETDTLDSVCDRGAVTDQAITIQTSGSQFGTSQINGDLHITSNLISQDHVYFGFNNAGAITLYFHDTDAFLSHNGSGFRFSDTLYLNNTLYVEGAIYTETNLYIDKKGTLNDSYIYFHDTDAYFNWDNVHNHFELSHELNVAGHITTGGNLYINYDGPDADSYLYFYNLNPLTEYLKWDNGDGRFELSDEILVSGDVIAVNDIVAYENIHINADGPDGDSYLYFYEGSSIGRYLKWDNGDNRFEFNDIVYVDGNIYGCSNIFINYNGPNGNSYLYFYGGGSPSGEFLRWTNSLDRFEFSNDVYVTGDLTTGGKVEASKDIEINVSGSSNESFLYFHSKSAHLCWDNPNSQFELSAKIDITGECRCDSFRIDQVPTVGTPTPAHYITISCDGRDYRIPAYKV